MLEHWLSRTDGSLRGARAELLTGPRVLGERSWRASARRGRCSTTRSSPTPTAACPLFVARRRLPRFALRDVPLVVVLHEFAYPWGRAVRAGNVWALSQRAALLGRRARVSRRSSSPAVPRRVARAPGAGCRGGAIGFAPVFSNLPAAERRGGRRPERPARASGCSATPTRAPPWTLVLDALRDAARPRPAGAAACSSARRGPPRRAAGSWRAGARRAASSRRCSVLGGAPAAGALRRARRLRCAAVRRTVRARPRARARSPRRSPPARPVVALDGRLAAGRSCSTRAARRRRARRRRARARRSPALLVRRRRARASSGHAVVTFAEPG